MASVAIVLRADKVNKKGLAPIHFRIIKDRKVSYIASSILIPIEQWDEKRLRIKSRYPNSSRLNSFLMNKFTEFQDQAYEFQTNQKPLTARLVKSKIQTIQGLDFFSYANSKVESYFNAGQIGTYSKNKSIIQKLSDYMEGKPLTFQMIDLGFILAYEEYLRDTLSNGTNTVLKDFKFIKKLFNDAIREDLLDYGQNPFLKYKMRAEKTTREYLTDEELTRFKNVKTKANSVIELHKHMFLFAASSGGLRVSDMLKLKWLNFDGTHLHFTIQKTSEQISIKIPNQGIEILQKYKPTEDNQDAFIFPCLPEDLNLNDPVALDLEISRATAYINKNLNTLRQLASIKKRVSFHVARHTWATRALRKGISIDKVSKLMGHSSVKVTQVYAKIVSSELDKAMDAFND